MTELVDTFATAVVTSFAGTAVRHARGQRLAPAPRGSDVTSTPGALQRVGPFAPLRARRPPRRT